MDIRRFVVFSLASLLVLPCAAPQTVATPMAASAPTAVPSLVPYSGGAFSSDGKPLASETEVTFQIFKEEVGGEPLWTEIQTVALDSAGHYKVQLGATNPNGLPGDLFATGEARWLEVQIAGQPAQPRVLLASVPYALKAGDATTLGGLPASAFALAGSKSASAITVPLGVTPEGVTAVTTTGGTSGYLPIFTGAATIADSIIFQDAAGIGIGDIPNSTAALDVNGKAIFRGPLDVSRIGNATTTAGVNSAPLVFYAQAYDSSLKEAVGPYFEWQAEPNGNNTAAPGATLNLLTSNGIAAAAETGLHFNPNGTINFAAGQVFPGTGTGNGTITEVTAGTDLTGGGSTGSVTLNLDTTKIPTLAANNTFTGADNFFSKGASFGGPVIATASGSGEAVAATGVNGAGGVTGSSDTGTGIYGYSTSPANGNAAVLGTTGKSNSATRTSELGSYIGGVWGDTTGNSNGVASGIIGTGDNAYAGTFFNNSTEYSTLFAENLSATGIALYGFGGGGTGVYGSGETGVSGFSESYVGTYGALGGESTEGANFNMPAGVWADTSQTGGHSLVVTADEGYSGTFLNDGSDYGTLYAENDAESSSSAVVLETEGGHFGGNCTITVSGNLTCSGKVAAVASVDNGARKVETYSMQSAENWSEDAGTAQLSRGAAHVDLEPVFGQTVNTGVEYHVFLTPDGDCKGLYVSAKSADGFDVRELGGGKSSIAFEYRIMAKRSGYEELRLADVTDQIAKQAGQREKRLHPADAHVAAHPSQPRPTLRPIQPGTRVPPMRIPIVPVQPAVKTQPAKMAELK